MRRHRVMMVLAGAAAVWCAAPLAVTAAPAAAAIARARTWRTAIEVPGLGSLNKGGHATVNSVSCGSAGNCVAGGSYVDGAHRQEAFVVSERNGTWGKAIEVPGSGSLNAHGDAAVASVSCASAGDCAAGGTYADGHSHLQAFVVSERNGTWGKAIEAPGSAILNRGGNARVTSVSCTSAGTCGAGGSYADGRHHLQAFVVSERNGSWRSAIEVPGSGSLNKGGNAQVASVSCGLAGTCAAGGGYTDGSGHPQGFVVSERNGRWGTVIRVPGLATLNKGEDASVRSVSCRSVGSCAAGGDYVDGSDRFQAFVVSETNGSWRVAIRVPGSGALNAGGLAFVNSVSCGSAGNCAAGGDYRDGHNNMQAFVVSERNGTWAKAIEVPGSGALNASGFASVNSVSCASAGNCAAGGFYQDRSGHFQGFVASERNGTWGRAIEVPGLGTLNKGGDAGVNSVSCRSAGNCAAGGSYADRPGIPPHLQAFVVSQA
jgi:hypothetical protein